MTPEDQKSANNDQARFASFYIYSRRYCEAVRSGDDDAKTKAQEAMLARYDILHQNGAPPLGPETYKVGEEVCDS